MSTYVPQSAAPGARDHWLEFSRQVVNDIRTNGDYTGPEVQVPFAPQLDREERRIVQVNGHVFGYYSTDVDQVDGPSVFGSGYVVAAAMAASAVRQAAATKRAALQWRDEGEMSFVITDAGFYAIDAAGRSPIAWGSYSAAQLTAWNAVEFTSSGDQRDQLFRIVTPAAILLFLLWCLDVYPAHPQFQNVLEGSDPVFSAPENQDSTPVATTTGPGSVSKTAYILCAIFLGSFGVHKFIAGKTKMGVIYLVFCWTLVPGVIALIEGIMAIMKPADSQGRISV